MENVDIGLLLTNIRVVLAAACRLSKELIWSKKGFQSIVSGHNEKHYFIPYYTVIVCKTSLSSNTIVSIE